MPESNQTIADTDTTFTGRAWSAILAAAAGCAVLGILTVLTELSVRVSHALTFLHGAGDLSGVTTVSLAIWLLAWVFLHRRWRGRSITRPSLALTFSLILILIGLLGTFPPAADWFRGK
jgi:hypothetical protein